MRRRDHYFPASSRSRKCSFSRRKPATALWTDRNASLDVLGGIRLWHLSSELQFQSGLLPGVNLERSRGWVDAIVGARARKDFSHKWAANVYGDVGGGGSDPTYQIVATANLNLHERYGLALGYRYLKVDYDKDNFLMDTALKGPIVGFEIKF